MATGGADLGRMLESLRRRGAASQIVITTTRGLERLGDEAFGRAGRVFVVIEKAGIAGGCWRAGIHVIPLIDPEHRGLRRAWQEMMRGL